MYKVEGYDKDNDVYVNYWNGPDLEIARKLHQHCIRLQREMNLLDVQVMEIKNLLIGYWYQTIKMK